MVEPVTYTYAIDLVNLFNKLDLEQFAKHFFYNEGEPRPAPPKLLQFLPEHKVEDIRRALEVFQQEYSVALLAAENKTTPEHIQIALLQMASGSQTANGDLVEIPNFEY